MNTPAQGSQKFSKYDKGLAELEELKARAKQSKPKKSNSYFFKSVLVTSFLFFLIFFIGFYFSYTDTKQKVEIESAKFTPKAQIKIPENSEKCIVNIPVLSDHNLKTTVENRCLQAQKSTDCEQIDQYNEIEAKDLSPDGKPDCKWSK